MRLPACRLFAAGTGASAPLGYDDKPLLLVAHVSIGALRYRYVMDVRNKVFRILPCRHQISEFARLSKSIPVSLKRGSQLPQRF